MHVFLLVLCACCAVPRPSLTSPMLLTSALDQPLFLQPFREVRKATVEVFGRGQNGMMAMRRARSHKMLQPQIASHVSFPCKVDGFRSPTPPTSVHKVKPGDIDIIAAMGDSLTAANGLIATQIFEVTLENRGMSWSIGGERDWRSTFTLPNAFKEFNPNLIGYSRRTSLTIEQDSQFNVAEPGAVSADMPYMAKILVKRIQLDPRVNLKEHWKVVTHMIGGNDFCLNLCFYDSPQKLIDEHREDLISVLRTLRDNLPRTIVNVVPPPNLHGLRETINKPGRCDLLNRFECPCIFALNNEQKWAKINRWMRKWQEVDEEITQMPEFHRKDFTVIYQPFTENIAIPLNSRNTTDFSYLSYDCFHLSQKMNAEAANGLWNNMFEPFGSKTNHTHRLFTKIRCPSKKQPYIFTEVNSRNTP